MIPKSIYVATPHALHYENARLCLEQGKPVLVEKSFTGNARQAQELISLSNEKKVFLAEAFWTRFIPARHIVRELLESGIIGEATSMKAVFEAPMTHIPRLTDPALAGGALLDIGVYTLNFASMFFGDDVEKIETTCVKYKTGVDGTDDIYYTYHDGKTAHLHTSILADSVTRNGTIFGTKGSVFVFPLIQQPSLYPPLFDCIYFIIKFYFCLKVYLALDSCHTRNLGSFRYGFRNRCSYSRIKSFWNNIVFA